MRIALAQLNYTIGDISGNTSKIIEAIERAKNEKADLVVFAEQAISGIPAFDLLTKTTFLELCEESLNKIASKCKGIDAIVGLPVFTGDGTVSAAAYIHNQEVVRYVGKQHISARREMGFLVPGKGCEVITIKNEKCAIVVGDDIINIRDFDHNIDNIISINARKYGKGALSYRYATYRDIAYINNKTFILINQVGGASDIVYDGTSGVFNTKGELMVVLKSFEEDFAIYDTNDQSEGLAQPPYTTYNDRTSIIYKAACTGLRDYFVKNGYEKACIGLSGGIDSAVVTAIAVAALGRENVMTLMLPSKFSSESSVTDAVKLAENLGIEYSVIPINSTYDTLIGVLKPVIGGFDFDVTEENIQARIRTIMLMALQNKRGYVLLNSSNKSENALGMSTLYGDTAGAISITGDLYKSEIYDLARYINKINEDKVVDLIPNEILEKEPSSELYPGQKDSDKLPPYEVVDAILLRMIEKGQHREEIVNAGFDYDVVEKIHSMVFHSEKKRYQFPPVLRLSRRSFGHERLMPLTNKYGD